MIGMLSWLVRHPLHSGILVGLTVAVIFGTLSFPRESAIDKQIDDWLPAGASSDQVEIDGLIAALEDARHDQASIERVSEEDFERLNLSRSYGFPRANDDGSFGIDYIGQRAGDNTVFVAERDVYAAPWWHPDRLLYRAVSYQTDRFGDGLRLTYERDWDSLGALLLMDIVVGVIYGGIAALILSVLGAKELDLPTASRVRALPREASAVPFAGAKIGQRAGGKLREIPDARRQPTP